MEIDLSTDNGRTWSRVWHQGAGDAVGPVSVPIPRAAGKSRVRVRFRYAGDDAWWWSVGDVLIGTPGCAALKGGLVTGLVTQRGCGRPVDGATVTASGSAAGAAPGIAAATGDPALSGGLYQVFSPAGRHLFTASAGGYAAASATVPVTAGQADPPGLGADREERGGPARGAAQPARRHDRGQPARRGAGQAGDPARAAGPVLHGHADHRRPGPADRRQGRPVLGHHRALAGGQPRAERQRGG